MNDALKRAARVEELDKAAEPGPWDSRPAKWTGASVHVGTWRVTKGGDHNGDVTTENGAFIAETRTLAPALAADVRAYDAALRELADAGSALSAAELVLSDAELRGQSDRTTEDNDVFAAQLRMNRAIDAAKKVLNG